MRLLSVETGERRIDIHTPAQDARKPMLRASLLEACEPPACVDAAAGQRAAGHEPAVDRREPLELALRCAAAATGAAPDRTCHQPFSDRSSCSTGIPAGTSGGGASCASA